jgi:hypothetical protein
MFLAWLLIVALIGGLTLYLIVRVSAAIRQWREPTTRWARRAAADRRRRKVPMPVERRAGPRRQEDVATEFLNEVGTRRGRTATARRT